MFTKKVTRTYLGRRRGRDVSKRRTRKLENVISLDSTDELSFPIDPFDKLNSKDVTERIQLKELAQIHASFNMDSSVEISRSEVSNRSSTPLQKSRINKTAQELNYSNLFLSPALDVTSIYTRFIPPGVSTSSVLISTPAIQKSPSAITQNDPFSTPVDTRKSRNSRNILKLSLKKRTKNVMFQEQVIAISDDNSKRESPGTKSKRRLTRKRKTKSVNENTPPLRKSTRNLNRQSAKTVEEALVSLDPNEKCNKLVLASGKWRKSLSAWKRKTQETKISNNQCSTRSLGCRMSMKIPINVPQDVVQTIVDQLENSLSEPIVLQETDDGLSNLSGLSLRDESESGKNILRQRSLIYENQFNEESDNNSYKQSLLRKRCTSVIEAPTFVHDTTTGTSAIEIVKQLNPKEIVLRRCRQTAPLKFSEIYSEQNLHNCRKIGEGVYGEVFMNKTAIGNTVVLKIIPIEGDIEVNGEPQKKFDEILAEIVIAMELSNLRNGKDFMTNGFVEVIDVRCVQGRYPEHLIDLWELYRDNHVTENDHPDLFTDDQLFIVLELSNAGQDLEAFTFSNALQSYSAFIQIAITLAVAEAKFQFEHRDLHWGNILLIPTDDKELTFKLNGKEIKIPTHGVKATVIDYTLSRMIFEGCCFFNDLSRDDELFSASGDYQFDIYRFMKNHLGNKWDRYEPYTNILWLHYTIDKMISGARYRNNKNKKHRSAIQDMMQLRDELLDYKNSCDYIKCLY